MAITHVFSGSASAANGGNPSINLGTLQQNDVVVVVGAQGEVAPTIQTAGYSVLITDDSGCGIVVGWKRMGGSPDSTVVIEGYSAIDSGTGAFLGVAASAIVLRGVDTTTAIDATTTTATGVSTNPDPPSITTVTNGAAVIALMATEISDASITAPSGYGNATSINASDTLGASSALAWVLKATAGAENPAAFTGVDDADWAAVTVALRPAAGVAGNPWYYYAQLQ